LRRKERASKRLRLQAMIWRGTYPAVGAEFGSRSDEASAARAGARYRTTELSADLGRRTWRRPIHLPHRSARHAWRSRLSTPHNRARWLTNAPASALVGVDPIKAVEGMKVGASCRP